MRSLIIITILGIFTSCEVHVAELHKRSNFRDNSVQTPDTIVKIVTVTDETGSSVTKLIKVVEVKIEPELEGKSIDGVTVGNVYEVKIPSDGNWESGDPFDG